MAYARGRPPVTSVTCSVGYDSVMRSTSSASFWNECKSTNISSWMYNTTMVVIATATNRFRIVDRKFIFLQGREKKFLQESIYYLECKSVKYSSCMYNTTTVLMATTTSRFRSADRKSMRGRKFFFLQDREKKVARINFFGNVIL